MQDIHNYISKWNSEWLNIKLSTSSNGLIVSIALTESDQNRTFACNWQFYENMYHMVLYGQLLNLPRNRVRLCGLGCCFVVEIFNKVFNWSVMAVCFLSFADN